MFKKLFSKDIWLIILIYFIWKILLTLVSYISITFLPLAYTDRFLGGAKNYFSAPLFYGWANFDGEHYLSIAIFGYKNLEQAFFPLYPKLISVINYFFSNSGVSNLLSGTIIGLVISNMALIISLILLFKLIKLDFSRKIAFLTVIILLLFPTSFYFSALYSESIFLLFTVASFYCARKGIWYLAGLIGILAAGTRVFGILLLPSLLIEVWSQKAKKWAYLWILLIPLGLGLYMLYLQNTVNDPVAFYTLQKNVGEQHQSGVILFPQVLFRYLKMIVTVNPNSYIYLTIILEFVTGILFFILPIIGLVKKIRLSYLFFSFFGFLIPTIQGSMSSSPRYILILFPSFLILALIINGLPKWAKIIYYCCSGAWLCLVSALFFRGYFVA